MVQATKAILEHYSTPPVHDNCPKGANSWCKYQVDIESKTSTYEPVNLLPPAIVSVLKPTFTALSDSGLLQATSRCLTQNANEAFHHVVWGISPKELSLDPSVISLGIDLGLSLFNDGYSQTYRELYQLANVTYGSNSQTIFNKLDKKRLQGARYQSSDKCKLRRKHKRRRARKIQDKKEKKNGPSYKSASFHATSLDVTGTSRRAPHCKTCGLPRKGHPKGKCATDSVSVIP